MPEAAIDKTRVLSLLNKILEVELAGVVRYTHYSFMVFGFNRIPIVSWLRGQATESLTHAQEAGEMITALGEHPSLGIGSVPETHKHDVGEILHEALEHETMALNLYRDLLALVEDRSILLEEYARQKVYEEGMHSHEVEKMLRKPGDVGPSAKKGV